jgi:hypothetical protein
MRCAQLFCGFAENRKPAKRSGARRADEELDARILMPYLAVHSV